MYLTRHHFLKTLGAAALLSQTSAFAKLVTENIQTASPVIGCKQVFEEGPNVAKVYFTKHIDSDHLIKLYNLVNSGIQGKTAIKLHTGEKNGPNILPRDMVKDFQKQVPNSTIVETNTFYQGDRYTTEGHKETLKVNGWTFCPVDILDEEGYVDFPVKGGKHFKAVAMGKNLPNYDSLIVLTHFKGHAVGGFGGSMKNIAIGLASGRRGKAQVHGVAEDTTAPWTEWPAKDLFMELMGESAKASCDHFGDHTCFLNVMRRMSVDCDCAGVGAAEPTVPDVGMLASKDILAVDQACVDLIYKMPKEQAKDLIERIESRHGLRQLSYMHELGMGKPEYVLIDIDDV